MSAFEDVEDIESITDKHDNIYFNINLSRCMARVQSERIFNREGGANEEYMEDTANLAVQMMFGGTQHWLKANNMYGYLYRNRGVVRENQWITIYVPDLRDIYRQHKHLLSRQDQLELSRLYPSPEFVNIYSYRSLQSYERMINVYEYQLRGAITKFDVLHFRAKEFIRAINKRYILTKGILIEEMLTDTPDHYNRVIAISLTWNVGDLFDVEYQRDMSIGKLVIQL